MPVEEEMRKPKANFPSRFTCYAMQEGKKYMGKVRMSLCVGSLVDLPCMRLILANALMAPCNSVGAWIEIFCDCTLTDSFALNKEIHVAAKLRQGPVGA